MLPCPGNRRKKLWEIPGRWHCPLIGTCLPVPQMRKLAARAGFDEREMSDYSLHTAVVCSCDSRTGIADLNWRIKEACKKLGKPCVFVQSPGISSFVRGLAALQGGSNPHPRIGLLT